MSEQSIPDGVTQVAKLMSEDPGVLWIGLKNALTTPDKIALFDKTVTDTITEFKNSEMNNKEIAEKIMIRAGEAILGPDRPIVPDNSVSSALNTAENDGFFLKEVTTKKKK